MTLINEFAKFETFLVDNYIIFDKFKEFQDVFSIFIEGLFASHAITDSHQTRLEYFDDWLITVLLQYGKPEIINKYYRRYKIKKIHYKKTLANGDSFSDLIDNFFDNTDLKELFVKNNEKNNYRFWDHYNRIFQNILIVASIADFDKDFINSFSKRLVNYLKDETFIHTQSYKQVNLFLYRCGEYLDKESILGFFDLGIRKQSFHTVDFYNSLLDTLEKKKETISISKEQFLIIKNHY